MPNEPDIIDGLQDAECAIDLICNLCGDASRVLKHHQQPGDKLLDYIRFGESIQNILTTHIASWQAALDPDRKPGHIELDEKDEFIWV